MIFTESPLNFYRRISHITEGLSPVLYHATHLSSFIKINDSNSIFLSNVFVGQADNRSLQKGKAFYLSCSRVPWNGYSRSIGTRDGVIIKLDGRKLSQHYKGTAFDYWGKEFRTPGEYSGNGPIEDRQDWYNDETEDRILSDDPEIKNFSSYILEVHICLDLEERINWQKDNKQLQEVYLAYQKALENPDTGSLYSFWFENREFITPNFREMRFESFSGNGSKFPVYLHFDKKTYINMGKNIKRVLSLRSPRAKDPYSSSEKKESSLFDQIIVLLKIPKKNLVQSLIGKGDLDYHKTDLLQSIMYRPGEVMQSLNVLAGNEKKQHTFTMVIGEMVKLLRKWGARDIYDFGKQLKELEKEAYQAERAKEQAKGTWETKY